MSGINDFIDNEVKSNDVVLFMKERRSFRSAVSPARWCRSLDYVGVAIRASTCSPMRICVRASRIIPIADDSAALRKGRVRRRLRHRAEMFQAGELQTLLQGQGISVKGAA